MGYEAQRRLVLAMARAPRIVAHVADIPVMVALVGRVDVGVRRGEAGLCGGNTPLLYCDLNRRWIKPVQPQPHDSARHVRYLERVIAIHPEAGQHLIVGPLANSETSRRQVVPVVPDEIEEWLNVPDRVNAGVDQQ